MKDKRRYLLITIDTEVDKDEHWRVSNPVTFRSVTEGIPRLLSPLFDRYGFKPTYMLSPEVIEDEECATVLKALDGCAELGAHLHCEFVEPERTLTRANMAGCTADAVQRQYPPSIEAAKLTNLVALFHRTFGYAPTSFRSGRYGMSGETLEILSGLGCKVDSSVTPGLRWDYKEGTLDYRAWPTGPSWVPTHAGRILEVPLSIRPRSALAQQVRDWPELYRRIARGIVGRSADYLWLRPSWTSARDLVHYAQTSDETFLNLMFHSMEVIPGASPYARTEKDVERILARLDALLAFCAENQIQPCGLSEVVDLV